MNATDLIIIDEIQRRTGQGEAELLIISSLVGRGVSPIKAREYLQKAGMNLETIFATPEPKNVIEIPVPTTQCGMNVLNFNGHSTTISYANHDRSIVVMDDFLSSAECDELVQGAVNRLTPSTTVNELTGESQAHEARRSSGMGYGFRETSVVATIEERLAMWTAWPIENGENMQLLRYLPGEEYRPHYDYFDSRAQGYEGLTRKSGQRVASIIMYLSDVPAGGCTYFPDLGFRVHPKKGRALFFGYDANNSPKNGLHAGEPVVEGEKWIATKWLRQLPVFDTQPTN